MKTNGSLFFLKSSKSSGSMLTLPMSKGHLRSFSVSADSPPIVSGLSPEVVAESNRIFSDFFT